MDTIHIFFPNGPPPPAAPPTSSSSLPSDEKDEELIKRITKLAEFSARNGTKNECYDVCVSMCVYVDKE